MPRSGDEAVRRLPAWVRGLLLSGAMLLVLAACSAIPEDDPDPPDAAITVRSGTLSTTVSHEGEIDVPFAEVILIDVTFEEEIIGAAGQTSVRVEADPIDYRVEERLPRDFHTYSFQLRNRSPGTATVRVYKDRETPPITFEVNVGLDDE